MKELVVALATYKQSVDETLLGIVEKLGDKLQAPTGTYFPTVYLQLKHIFGSDVNWMKRLKTAFPQSSVLGKSRFGGYDLEALKALPPAEHSRYFADQRELDAELCAFVAELEPAAFASTVTYKNYQGQSETHELWKVFLHWFNHGVHHRGTISGQLDILGVENDYSALLPRI